MTPIEQGSLTMHRIASLLILLILLAVRPVVAARPDSDSFFASNGVRIRYIDRGERDAEPVMLIHGFSRTIELNWLETGLIDELSWTRRVVALDCRGHGKSDKPTIEGAYGIEMVEDVARLLDHLEIERADIVGYSMGARIALRFTATHPERVTSTALIGGGGARAGSEGALWDELAASIERGDGFRPLIIKVWPTDQPRPTDEQIAALDSDILSFNNATALAQVAAEYSEFTVSDREIDAIDTPVHAIVGSNDWFRRSVDELRAVMPEFKVRVIDGANHLDVLSRAELRSALSEFLSR